MAELSYFDPGVGSALPATGGGGWNWRGTLQDVGAFVDEAGVGAIGSGLATTLSFVGAMMQAKQAKKAANYNAEVIERNTQAAASAAEIEAQQRERNAAILLQDISFVRQAQAEQERSQQAQADYLASQTRAIIGASGLMMSGSPLAVQEYGIQARAREIAAGRYKAEVQERALRDAATMEGYAAAVSRYGAGERLRVGGAQAALARWGGSQQAAAGRVGALGGLASGTARTVATYERHRALRSASGVSSGRDID